MDKILQNTNNDQLPSADQEYNIPDDFLMKSGKLSNILVYIVVITLT